MENQYLKIPNYDIFTQKNIPRPSSFNLKCRKLLNYCPDISKFANRASSGYYSTKNIFLNNSNIFPSPHYFNIFSIKTQTPKTKKISRIKPKSASYKRIFPDAQNILSRSMYSNSCLEAEKLFQETYEIKKVIKHLQNQLNKITKENNKKERQLNAKENEINKIIINNFELNNEDEEDKNNYYNYLNNCSNINEIKLNKKNSAVNLLIFKIRREIKNIQNETLKESNKLEEMKKSLFLTKSKELSIESNLYREHINKIKLLIENSLQIKEQNDIKKDEYESLKENIERQNLIIDNLTKENILLENKQDELNIKLEILQNDLKAKIEQAKKNDNELNILSIKNKNLSKDKLIQKQFNMIKEDIFPISLKSIYTGRVSTLKKNINFYKMQIKYSEEMLNKLKDQKKKLIDSNQSLQQKIKINPNFMNRPPPTSVKTRKRPQSSISISKENKLDDKDRILKLRKDYKKIREEELALEKKANVYYNKLREINMTLLEEKEKKSESEEKKSQNQLEFGIDETNPYYTDNEENIPESNIKFTSQQFNQFTYILFKNFEAKNIVSEEAKNKIIKPFLEIIQKNNYDKISHPSTEFDEVVEHLSKIILKVLNTENEYNHTLTKIFIGALLYNSDCDINKLIEYFSILFSYTKDYSSEEKKYIEKLKTKYKNETKKLVECITSYVLNDLTSSQYFSLFKMKDLLDNNQINLKDKYIEFLFYFLKKFDDPEAKLEDLKYSLFNEIVPLGDTTVHSKALVNKNEEEENDNVDLDKIENLVNNEKNEINKDENINIEENKDFNFDLDKYKENDINIKTNKTEPNREENIFEKNQKKKKKKEKKQEKGVEDNNISLNKAKEESKKNSDNIDKFDSNNKIDIDNSNINKESGKKLNADLFDDIDEIENNNNNNESNINNVAKINHNEHDDIKNNIDNNIDNNDNGYVDQNKKDLAINNIENDKNEKNNSNDILNIEKQEINQKKEEELSNKSEKKNENEKEEEKKDEKQNENEKKEEKKDENENINNISTEKLIRNQRANTEEEKKDQNQNKKSEHEKEDQMQKEKKLTNKSNNTEKEKNKFNESENEIQKEKNKTNKSNKTDKEKDKFNESENENENESVTEITNEDFIKHIKDSLNLIQTALEENSLDFINFIEDNVQKIKLGGKFYDYVNIEDLNDKLIGIRVVLSDMQLSCLCSKFSLPEELRLIDVKNFEKSLRDFKNGNLKLL